MLASIRAWPDEDIENNMTSASSKSHKSLATRDDRTPLGNAENRLVREPNAVSLSPFITMRTKARKKKIEKFHKIAVPPPSPSVYSTPQTTPEQFSTPKGRYTH